MLQHGFRRLFVRLLSVEASTSKPRNREESFGEYRKTEGSTRKPLPPQKQTYLSKNKMRSSGDTRFGSYNNGFGNYSNSYSGSSGYGGSNGGYGMSGFGGAPRSNGFAGQNLREVNYNINEMASIEKNFYQEHADVTNRSVEEVGHWIRENEVTLNGKNIPRPIFNFNEAGLPPAFEQKLYQQYEKPTTIQSISWPVAMSGRDMISIARTGSGKTLGFLLPGIMHVINQPQGTHRDGPRILVMLPTRELAQQVEEVARTFCPLVNLRVTCLFGGAAKINQGRDLKNGVDIVIATPGRLLDFLESGTTTMNRCSFLVLDEADRMLDMGFEPQIRKIVSQIRPDRQTLMFSATWPKEVRNLASDFQTEPVYLNVGSLELSANHNITQYVEVVSDYQKNRRLFEVLTRISEETENKTLIFVQTKRKADELTSAMRRDGWPALCIHGDKSQGERDWVMNEFKTGSAPILLATDVASRGLDVSDIKFVINYDYPNNSEDYVHRIGRTGRRDNKGTAFTFFTLNDAQKARDLIKVLSEANQHVPPELQELQNGGYSNNSRFGGGGGSRYGGGGFRGSNGYGGRY